MSAMDRVMVDRRMHCHMRNEETIGRVLTSVEERVPHNIAMSGVLGSRRRLSERMNFNWVSRSTWPTRPNGSAMQSLMNASTKEIARNGSRVWVHFSWNCSADR